MSEGSRRYPDRLVRKWAEGKNIPEPALEKIMEELKRTGSLAEALRAVTNLWQPEENLNG